MPDDATFYLKLRVSPDGKIDRRVPELFDTFEQAHERLMEDANDGCLYECNFLMGTTKANIKLS